MQPADSRQPRLYLQVAEQLQARITEGAIEEGERLPSERDLAAQLGVSRPTIREAIIALEIAGLVEVRTGSGVYVRTRGALLETLADNAGPGPFEILEARILIEGETAALAAAQASAETVTALYEQVDAMIRENAQEKVSELSDERFHRLIAEASGNSALAATVAWLWQLRNESVISAHYQQRIRREGIRPVVEDHRSIVDAISAGDSEAARAAMQRHLRRVISHLMDDVA